MGRGCQQAVPVSEGQSWVKGSRSQAEPEQGEPRVFQAAFKALCSPQQQHSLWAEQLFGWAEGRRVLFLL